MRDVPWCRRKCVTGADLEVSKPMSFPVVSLALFPASAARPATCRHAPLPGQTLTPLDLDAQTNSVLAAVALGMVSDHTNKHSQGRLSFLVQVFLSIGMTGLYHHTGFLHILQRQPHYADQAGLQLRRPSASSSLVLGLKAHSARAGQWPSG